MRLAIFIFALLLPASLVLGAQDAKKDAFWGSLQGKVHKLTAKKKTTAPAVVAGIKGTKNEHSDIYWKGKEKRIEVDEDELQQFNHAMECQSKGEKAEALAHFEAFLKDYPSSPLYQEGTQAVLLLKQELPPQTPAKTSPVSTPVTTPTAQAAVDSTAPPKDAAPAANQ